MLLDEDTREGDHVEVCALGIEADSMKGWLRAHMPPEVI